MRRQTISAGPADPQEFQRRPTNLIAVRDRHRRSRIRFVETLEGKDDRGAYSIVLMIVLFLANFLIPEFPPVRNNLLEKKRVRHVCMYTTRRFTTVARIVRRFPKGLPRGWQYFNGHVDCTRQDCRTTVKSYESLSCQLFSSATP